MGLTTVQQYLFDLDGYVLINNVIDQSLIEELKDSLEGETEQYQPVPQQSGPLHWGRAWRDLLDIDAVSEILEELIGNAGLAEGRRERTGQAPLPTFRLDHINVHTHVTKGFEGMALHGGWKGTGGAQFFRYHDGHFYNGLVVVAFELFDTHPNDGGFCCVPGSHKSNLPFPDNWRDPSEGLADCVRRIPAAPGDAIVFTEALIHGTLPWQVDDPRQTLFYKFSPHATSWSGDFFKPADFYHYNDMDDRKLAILEPPNARYAGRPTRPDRSEAGEN